MAILRRSARGIGAMTAAVLVLTSGITGAAFADEPDSSPSVSEVSTQNVDVSHATTQGLTSGVAPQSDPVCDISPGHVTINGANSYDEAKVGATLTAAPGAWSPKGVTLKYQWLRDYDQIPGATGKTYKLTAADVDSVIDLEVTGNLPGCDYWSSEQVLADNWIYVEAASLTKATPTIIGTAAVGKTLTAKPGSWTKGATFKYQWYRNSSKIKGATKSTYKVTKADAGKKLKVKVTGSLKGYETASKASATTKTVPKLKLKTAKPKIAGTAKVGKTLTAKKGTWTSGTSVSYQWYRNGKKITGATKSTYKLKAADSGKKISVKATGKKTGYTTASKTSGKTKAVAKGTLSAAKPKISGSAKVGKTLKVKTGKWSPSSTKVSYQWKRNGKKISGAKKSSYKVKAADKGKRISVTVTGKASGYKSKSVTSSSTAVVKYPSSMYPSGWKCPSWAPIKGNASSMIYHVPGGAYYSRTNPEQCFASTSAAKSAGYRASKR